MSKTQQFLIFLVFVLLAGCSIGPKYERPEMEIPCEWHSAWNLAGRGEGL